MTHRTRQVLLALTVTTALCADQFAVAAPTMRPQVAELAGRIVNRLTSSFRQAVTVEMPVHARQRFGAAQDRLAPIDPSSVDIAHTPLSPFQFRLPPPSL
jgi:hypothetical protein